MGGDGPLVSMDVAQAGDVSIGDVAGGNIYHLLADLPPGIRQALADSHESQRLTILALERQADRTARLEGQLRAYTTGEAIERAARQEETDRMHRLEQAMLLDGLAAIREQLADAAGAVSRLRGEQRRMLIGLLIVAAIIVGLLADRAASLWLAAAAMAWGLIAQWRG